MKTYRIRYRNTDSILRTMMVLGNDNQSAIESFFSKAGMDVMEIVEVREW
jgi:hypothetical protein